MSIFKNYLFAPHDFHPQNFIFSSNLNQLPWISTLRVLKGIFLTPFLYLFFDFVLDCLKPRVGVYFCVGLGKLNLCKKISILMIGLSPICVDVVFVGPMGHFNMYLRHIFIWSCIVYHIRFICAC